MQLSVDFGKTADDYRKHRAGFPAELFRRLAAKGIGVTGQRILDLGTGTGSLARGFATAGATAFGSDIALSMMQAGRRLDADAGVEVTYLGAGAEALPFQNDCLDVVTAGQCWHWFKRDVAAAEVRRVLRPGARLAICHFDWIPLPGNVVAASEALIEAHNPAWAWGGGNGIHAAWLADVAQAGFEDIETFSFDVMLAYSHADWRGRLRASAGVAGSLPPDGVRAFDHGLAEMLLRDFPQDPLSVHHRTFALTATAP